MKRFPVICLTILSACLLFYLGNRVCLQVRGDMTAGLPASEIIDRIFVGIAERPLFLSLHRADLIAGLGAVIAIGLIWLYRWSMRRDLREGEEHGSAKWGTPADIRPFRQGGRHDLLMTATESLGIDGRVTRRNLNVLVIGSSGSGKTRRYVLPNLRQANMSYAITDPKGEIQNAVGELLRGKGYAIHCLNLIDLERSDRFNPMRYLNPSDPEAGILRLTENIITNTAGDNRQPGNGDGFWERAERNLLNALIAWVRFAEDEPDLNRVTDMLDQMEASEADETMQSDVDLMFDAARELVAEYHADPGRHDVESRQTLEGLDFAARQYRKFQQGAGETKKSIIISLGVRLAPLQVGSVRRILSGDDMRLDKIALRPTAVFLALPDTENTFSFLAAILYQCLFESNVYQADHAGGGSHRLPVHCFLDEFANVGRIPNFQRLIATIRSRKISCSVIIQNYAQGKAMYRDDWETIVGNCDSMLFLGGTETSTLEWVSKRLGSQTIDVMDDSESKGINGSYTTSWRRTKRELLQPDELGLLPTDECIYILRGVRPFRSRKIPM
ncbi:MULTISPECIES: VirD4-like conjugal transfer protein, CD1115 family [Bifidobacterium]|uniref:TraG/TraD family protein n=1 Tax=Bifidobacterium oedipodis TaxID=2675322 RepID=A0A7Y0EN96_9BIFI|nr:MULTISPECIES: type IV secretory system conjugative DNA transfer family protein [Bifidobacterium]MBW3079034.1 type IV secretory system conjugative DNA transfer family protein [Bifidobacterium simiiventris]NMM93399.1 TraG/TraD family protein [Bifidobacterium sp. DSM 109957]